MEFRRKNHYVPESHLKRWADGDGRIWAYRLLVSHPRVPTWKPCSPSAVAYHQHLYTSTLSGREDDEIERWLEREYENPAQEPIRKAISGHKMRPIDWERLALYAVAQDVRTPSRMLESIQQMRSVAPDFLNETLDDLGRQLESGETLDTGLPGGQVPLAVKAEPSEDPDRAVVRARTYIGRGYWHYILRHLMINTAPRVVGHAWTVLRAPEGIEWITSDVPMARINMLPNGEFNFGGGWGSTGTQLVMPLSPEHLLHAQVGLWRPPRRGTVVSRDDARIMNQVLAMNAHRQIISRQPQLDSERWNPRVVDRRQYEAESSSWEQWNEFQRQAEHQIRPPPPPEKLED